MAANGYLHKAAFTPSRKPRSKESSSLSRGKNTTRKRRSKTQPHSLYTYGARNIRLQRDEQTQGAKARKHSLPAPQGRRKERPRCKAAGTRTSETEQRPASCPPAFLLFLRPLSLTTDKSVLVIPRVFPPRGVCTVPGSTAIPGRCVEWTEQAPIPTPNPKNPFNILSSDRGRIRY